VVVVERRSSKVIQLVGSCQLALSLQATVTQDLRFRNMGIGHEMNYVE